MAMGNGANQKRLVIELLPNGNIKVGGCVRDLPLSYAMLEMAKDAIRLHHSKPEEEQLVTPVRGLLVQ